MANRHWCYSCFEILDPQDTWLDKREFVRCKKCKYFYHRSCLEEQRCEYCDDNTVEVIHISTPDSIQALDKTKPIALTSLSSYTTTTLKIFRVFALILLIAVFAVMAYFSRETWILWSANQHFQAATDAFDLKDWEMTQMECYITLAWDNHHLEAQKLLRESYYQEAIEAVNQQQWKNARLIIQTLIELDPSYRTDEVSELNIQTYYQPAVDNVKEKKWQNAQNELQELLRLNKNYKDSETLFKETYYQPGIDALSKGEFQQAVDNFLPLLALDSEYKDGKALLCESYYQLALSALAKDRQDEYKSYLVKISEFDNQFKDVNELLNGKLVYQNDFENAVSREWSKVSLEVAPNKQKFLGLFSNDVVKLTLSDLPEHHEVELDFDLYIIDSWDGNDITYGQDIWSVSVENGPVLLKTNFAWDKSTQSYPSELGKGYHPANSGATAVRTLGYEYDNRGPADATYHLTYRFSHNGNKLVLIFTGDRLEGINNESWGLDNIAVRLHDIQPTGEALALKISSSQANAELLSTNTDIEPETVTPKRKYSWNVSVVDQGPNVGRYASLGLFKMSRPEVAYYDDKGQNLKFAIYSNNDTWDLSSFTRQGVTGLYSWLVMDGDNQPHVAYFDESEHMIMETRKITQTWDFRKLITVDNISGLSLALDAMYKPHIVYLDDSNKNVMYASVTNRGTTMLTIGNGSAEGIYFPLVLDKNDNAHTAYYDASQGLVYAYLENDKWITQVVDHGTGVGLFPSISLDHNGNPNISYYDQNLKGLKYAVKSGSIWNKTIVDMGNTGKFTSLAVSSEGIIHISYYDEGNTALKYARLSDGEWDIYTVDNDGDVGQFSSLSLDLEGNARICYYAKSGGQLKYAYPSVIIH